MEGKPQRHKEHKDLYLFFVPLWFSYNFFDIIRRMDELDDLDQLLAMEIRGEPEGRKKVSSLEAQVLSRVQKSLPQEERTLLSLGDEESKEETEPIQQYAEALAPIIESAQGLLSEIPEPGRSEEIAKLRTRLAERLLALPEVEVISKAGIFAAMAMCIDAAGATETETRRAARERLNRLTSRLESARAEADRRRLLAVENFLKSQTIT
jgi:hypothetical protein